MLDFLHSGSCQLQFELDLLDNIEEVSKKLYAAELNEYQGGCTYSYLSCTLDWSRIFKKKMKKKKEKTV